MPKIMRREIENVRNLEIEVPAGSLTMPALKENLSRVCEGSPRIEFDAKTLSISEPILGYSARTHLYVKGDEPTLIAAETVFSELPVSSFNWVGSGLLLLLGVLVFLLPEWYLGLLMVAATLYVAIPVLLRNLIAKLRVRKIVYEALRLSSPWPLDP